MSKQGRAQVSEDSAALVTPVCGCPAWWQASPPYSNADMISKSAACLDCHQEAADNLKGSTASADDGDDKSDQIDRRLHRLPRGWEKHLENPTKDNIVVPANLALAEAGGDL